MMKHTLRLLGLAAALPLALSACNSGTKAGDTNVELGSAKEVQANKPQGVVNGDSLAAGLQRDTARRPSGKEVYKAAGQSRDRNHDGIAD